MISPHEMTVNLLYQNGSVRGVVVENSSERIHHSLQESLDEVPVEEVALVLASLERILVSIS